MVVLDSLVLLKPLVRLDPPGVLPLLALWVLLDPLAVVGQLVLLDPLVVLGALVLLNPLVRLGRLVPLDTPHICANLTDEPPGSIFPLQIPHVFHFHRQEVLDTRVRSFHTG